MRIAHLLRKYNPAEWGGTETVIHQLFDGLRREGTGSVVYCPSIGASQTPDPLVAAGCAVQRFSACVPIWGISAEQRRQMIAVGDGRGRNEVAAALNAAASYAVKSELDPDGLSQLVRIAASGDALFVRASRRALERLVLAEDDVSTRFGLTARELDVLTLMAAGRTNAEIATELHLAPSSAKKLVSRCLARLGVRNRVEAALLARREGLVAAPPAGAGT